MPKFTKGNKFGKGGEREGSGRPKDELIRKCRELVEKEKIVEFISNVAKGGDEEQVVTTQGTVLQVPAAIRDRLRASEMLLERGYGKPEQSITVDSNERPPDEALINRAIARIEGILSVVEGLKEVETGE